MRPVKLTYDAISVFKHAKPLRKQRKTDRARMFDRTETPIAIRAECIWFTNLHFGKGKFSYFFYKTSIITLN